MTPRVTTAGYQGTPAPDQWFGGPALANAGSMVLRDAAGLVVDSLNYGGLVDPWAAEGYQGTSGAGEDGCSVTAPVEAGRFWWLPAPPAASDRSAGRFPDGLDTDSNCTDFQMQPATTLSADAGVGTANIKVADVDGFGAGQTIRIGTGANLETAVVSHVGTSGATKVGKAAAAGETEITVESVSGFSQGQTIYIDSGANFETAVVVDTQFGFPAGFRGRPGRPATITVAMPLTYAHAAGAQVSGSGITLTTALTKTHPSGAQVGGNVPTPGAPNEYDEKRQ